MNKTIIFLETSLSHSEAKTYLPDACYMPSVKKGDVLKAIKEGFDRIVIMDGNFGWTASVWHKEILTAIDYGIEVYGSSSMGAIRAAELDLYGMKGIGIIYEMYKNNVIDGDDEIAIAYSKYNDTQTIPFINIRKTLEHLNFYFDPSVLEKIRQIFYGYRTWEKIAETVPDDLYRLIRLNYMDIKKSDAILTLTTIRELPIFRNTVNKNRQFTCFEKNLFESVFENSLYQKIELQKNGNSNQLMRAKNIIKLLSIQKTKSNLIYYQSLIYLIDKQEYAITEFELMEKINLFREEKNLLSGAQFKLWISKQYLLYTNLENLFVDYIKLKKYLLMSMNYNDYFF